MFNCTMFKKRVCIINHLPHSEIKRKIIIKNIPKTASALIYIVGKMITSQNKIDALTKNF